jgi:hypothetical protein
VILGALTAFDPKAIIFAQFMIGSACACGAKMLSKVRTN